jgi:glutamate-5-semialdehyde dehydrogenase
MTVAEKARAAKQASLLLAALPGEQKDRALSAIADGLRSRRGEIEHANAADVAAAEHDGLAAPLTRRLGFALDKIEQSALGVESVASLEDPVGRVLQARELDRGLNLYQVTVPIGVVGMIFESRPDALVQIASLCLKSGNSVLLKGGTEASRTNRVLYGIIDDATRSAGLPDGWIALLESRDDVREMLRRIGEIDLIIPRGSNEFVRHIMENTSIPVLGHADGVCHVYVDADADVQSALAVIVDSKTQYPAVCNAAETLLVHRDIAATLLGGLADAMPSVELRGCPRTVELLPKVKPAQEADWSAEYLDYVLAVRIVDSIDEAVQFINRYGSHHTDAIMTAKREHADQFMRRVDSASIMWNCSTRFADGFRYGLGAEVGIATGKIHARGPVGLDGLVIYQWRLFGSGQVVADYAAGGTRSFTHRRLV